MWTADKVDRRFAEPSPEIKTQARAMVKEGLIKEAQKLCGPQGREWFEAMLDEFQAAQSVPAPSLKARAGATSSPDALAEVAPLATPKGTHSASPSTVAGASPLTNPILARRDRMRAEAAKKISPETQPIISVKAKAEPEDGRLRPTHVRLVSSAPDQEPENDEDAGADAKTDEAQGEATEPADVQLWRIGLLLPRVQPVDKTVDGIGGLLWWLTDGKEKGWELWSGWAGKRAEKSRWNDGLRKSGWKLEQLWTMAQRQGWRYPMIVSLNKLDWIAGEAERAMIRGGAGIYQIGLELVTVVTKEVEGTKGRKTRVAVLDPVRGDGLASEMSKFVNWHKLPANGKPVPTAVPDKVVNALLARRGRWGFERINGVIMTPTLRRDGSVLKAEGLDPTTGLFLLGPVPVVGRVGETRADAEQAIRLLDGLLDDFPFVDPASRSVALSGLVTPVVRGACTCVPMHVSSAPGAGSGKTYLWDVAAAIAVGDICPISPAGKNVEEMEKRLNSELLAGQTLVSIDNVNCALGGDTLCVSIERPTVNIRVLGYSVSKERRNRWTLFASGVNVRLLDDVTRRALMSRIDAGREDAISREFERNPFDEVMSNRGRYIEAALTVVRAYMLAGHPGRPKQIGDPFAEWSDLVRGALMWLGRVDPVLSMEAARAGDPWRQATAALFAAIGNAYGFGPEVAQPVADMIQDAEWGGIGARSFKDRPSEPDERAVQLKAALEGVAAQGRWINAKFVGIQFNKNAGRIVDGLRLGSVYDGHAKRHLWYVEKVGA
jgi:putative DNA primase/helicase